MNNDRLKELKVGDKVFVYDIIGLPRSLETVQDITLKGEVVVNNIKYKEGQNTNQGGSGPVVMPLILFTKLLTEKKYKKILKYLS